MRHAKLATSPLGSDLFTYIVQLASHSFFVEALFDESPVFLLEALFIGIPCLFV